MRRFLLGVCLGCALSAPPVWALRIARPPTLHEWNSNTFTQLNDVLLQLWNAINGRLQMDRVLSDPDGTRPCSIGEEVFYDTGTDQHCICADEDTKAWKCVNLS